MRYDLEKIIAHLLSEFVGRKIQSQYADVIHTHIDMIEELLEKEC